MASFFGFLMGNDTASKIKEKPKDKIVFDQDTVIGDAMCHASQMIYDCVYDIANCINDNNQAAIDLEQIRSCEKALCYMEGVVFGLAMDDKAMKWYMTELTRCMHSVALSRENGFQTQVYVPTVKPCDLFGFDEVHCRNNPVTFLRINARIPSEDYVKCVKEELAKDESFKYLFEKGILDWTKFPGAPTPPPQIAETTPSTIGSEDGDAKESEDDAPSVLNLRNLYRQSKIDKSQYIGGLATLVATGLINKAEFTRLKAAAN